MARNRRVIYRSAGGSRVVDLIEEPVPQPRADEVCVAVEAAGIAFADIVQRNGLYPGQPAFPMTPGYDVCGRVHAVGREAAQHFAKGQRVAGVTVFGGYADYVCTRADHLIPVPEDAPAVEVVALCLNYITASQMLHRCAAVEPGDRVLIHAAGGGVGTALLELGGLFDLEMFGTVSKAKADIVKRLSGVPIDYRKRDFVREIDRLTGGAGVMAAFDAIGGRHARRSLKTLSENGRLVVYGLTSGFPSGRRDYLRLGLDQMLSSVGLMTVFISAQGVLGYNIEKLRTARPRWYREDLTALMAHLAAGRLRPVIAGTFPLADTRAAQEAFLRAQRPGKTVLLCAGSGV
ncbi:MAG: zinc-binding dehydrogenase [Alphaproteobacteria bacterium]